MSRLEKSGVAMVPAAIAAPATHVVPAQCIVLSIILPHYSIRGSFCLCIALLGCAHNLAG